MLLLFPFPVGQFPFLCMKVAVVVAVVVTALLLVVIGES